MGLNIEQKKAVVAEVSAHVAKAQAIVVAEYRGLEVGNMTELRREARKSGVYLRVLKNTLARRAVSGTPFEKLTDQLTGPLIYGISPDPVATAWTCSLIALGGGAVITLIRVLAYKQKWVFLSGAALLHVVLNGLLHVDYLLAGAICAALGIALTATVGRKMSAAAAGGAK